MKPAAVRLENKVRESAHRPDGVAGYNGLADLFVIRDAFEGITLLCHKLGTILGVVIDWGQG